MMSKDDDERTSFPSIPLSAVISLDDYKNQSREAEKDASKEKIIDDWEPIIPLPDTLPPVEKFELDLLPEAFKSYVREAAASMACPPENIAVPLMVALGATIGSRLTMKPSKRDNWQVVPNIWGMVVGKPGTMKSAANKAGLVGIQELEKLAKAKNAEAAKDYATEKEAFDERKKISKKQMQDAFNQNLHIDTNEIRHLFVEDLPPQAPNLRYIVNDASYEKLGEICADNPEGILVNRDELMGLIGRWGKEDFIAERSFFLEAWDGDGTYNFDRIGRGSISIETLCISVLGGIQPAKIAPFIKDAINGGAGDDGALQRFSLAVWADDNNSWTRDAPSISKASRENVIDTFLKLDELDIYAIGAKKNGGLPYLEFTDEAQNLFFDWREKLEADNKCGEGHPALISHFSKYRKLIPALSMLIFLANGGTNQVDAASLKTALRWEKYLRSHAQRLYASGTMPELTAAHVLLQKIKSGALGNEFTVKEIQTKNWGGLNDNQTIKDACNELADCNYIQQIEPDKTRGRPSLKYRVNLSV